MTEMVGEIGVWLGHSSGRLPQEEEKEEFTTHTYTYTFLICNQLLLNFLYTTQFLLNRLLPITLIVKENYWKNNYYKLKIKK